jgi:glycosyltransferase involved in cell wall biosynthesis
MELLGTKGKLHIPKRLKSSPKDHGIRLERIAGFPMKVLIQNRPDVFEIFGGDSVQMIKTAECLRNLGVHVDISLELTPALNDYDLVHLMNITRVAFTHAQLINAKKQDKKVVLSPIYWSTREVVSAYFKQTIFDLNSLSSLKELGKACFLSLAHRSLLSQISELTRNRRSASAVLSEVDCLLPNSSAEIAVLKHDFPEVFGNREKEFAVIPNGVDANLFYNSSPEKFIEKYSLSDFVLNVGHFSCRKNQLALINALKGLGLNVVFIGESANESGYHYGIKNTVDKLYYQKCKREADNSFTFLGAMTHNEIAGAYAACKVLAMPSFYETPGLSALEAALSGANICITTGGSTREYFSQFAFYCDPHDVDSIREAVLQAYQNPKSVALKEHVLAKFTWDKAAEATLEAYEKVLEK